MRYFDLNESGTVIDLLATQANAKGLKFTETGEIIVHVERLENLILKKSQINSPDIDNYALNRPITIKFSIKDTGIGIYDPDQKKLFQQKLPKNPI